MQVPPHNYEAIAKRAAELLGGQEAFAAAAEKELADINERWNQNVEVVGRILRAHLFAEHFMTEYLANANPRLGSLSAARATFGQKIHLLDSKSPDVADVLPGIKHLNAVRNRLAHNLNTQVSDADAKIFLSSRRFAAMRAAKAQDAGKAPSDDPLSILEDFARHLSTVFTYDFGPVGRAIQQAIEEIHSGRVAN